MTLLRGRATADGTRAFAARFPGAAAGHFRPFFDLSASSIGLGTYLGTHDEATDAAVRAAVASCIERGVNLIDTAINYRCMRGERSIGAAIAELVAAGKLAREEVIVATKGGFVPFDGAPPHNAAAYVHERFIATGLAEEDEIVAGCHCLAPKYLASQIEESRKNLGLETLDVLCDPGCDLGDDAFAFVGDLTAVTSLNLKGRFGDPTLALLTRLPRLRNLTLRCGRSCTSAGLKTLASLPLRELWLDSSATADEVASALGGHPTLRRLTLYGPVRKGDIASLPGFRNVRVR